MRQITATSAIGTLLVEGNPQNPTPSLISNADPANTLFIGKERSLLSSDPLSSVPLFPGQFTTATGKTDVYGITQPNQTALVKVFDGMTSFFSL